MYLGDDMSALRPPATASWIPFAGIFGLGASRRAPVRRIDPVLRAPSAPIPRASAPADRILAAARKAPQLELIEWDGDGASVPAYQPAARSEPLARTVTDDACEFDAMRRKIRDRYIGARFPGVVRGSADLADAERVIKSARLLFEEERLGDALELLQLAIDEMPAEPSRWLALLEILYLSRDALQFTATARDFRRRHAGAQEAWTEICRLGRALAPAEVLFGVACAPRDHEHYGPWPHTPNWIQAPWDLTSDIAAADFHRAMVRNASNA
jgi:hypothetical protein